MVLLALGCIEYGVHNETRRDSWEQKRRNHAALLFVVDNSRSMLEEQEALGATFAAMLAPIQEADISWEVAVTTVDTQLPEHRGVLVGDADAIEVWADDVLLDRVAWGRRFEAGIAWQLAVGAMHPDDNDDDQAWCAASTPFDGGWGTPGRWNPTCNGGEVEAPSGGADAGPRAPEAGDVVITEVMARSGGVDAVCEWFELTNLTPDTLELDEVWLHDDGGRDAWLPAGAVLAPYQALVVGPGDGLDCGVDIDLVAEGGLSLADGTLVLDESMDDAGERFAEAVAVGMDGYGLEMGLQAAELALDGTYEGVFPAREPSSLTIVIVSDEDDLSPDPVADHVHRLTSVMGDDAFRHADQVRVVAITGTREPSTAGGTSCESASGSAEYGARYLRAAELSGGLAASICGDFGAALHDVGATVDGLEHEFGFSTLPVLETLIVEQYASVEDASPERTLALGTDYDLELRQRTVNDFELVLIFPEDAPPPSESAVTATYTPLPPGVDPMETFEEFAAWR